GVMSDFAELQVPAGVEADKVNSFAASVGQRLSRPIFPPSHRLACLEAATFEGIRAALTHAPNGDPSVISTIWGTPSFTGISERSAVRPDKGTFRGTATDGNDRMPYVGFWLSKPGSNEVMLLEDGDIRIDPSL